ncbi:hypothetical protein CYL16_01115 [Mycobacterium sp. EPG1]|nr:hypothetical protein CYL16_01115 [Mycobacterium sp. EPG1]
MDVGSIVDWATIANVSAGALAAVAGQLIPAFSKRGDRRHQTDLEFEKRAWEDKRTALLALIRWGRGIQRETTRQADPIYSYHPRADALLYAVTHPLEPGDEVTAFTSQEVQKKYEALKGLIDGALTFPVRMMLAQVRQNDAARAEAEAAAVAADLGFSQLATAGESAVKATMARDSIEKALKSKLNPDELNRLAGELLIAASADLRGGKT